MPAWRRWHASPMRRARTAPRKPGSRPSATPPSWRRASWTTKRRRRPCQRDSPTRIRSSSRTAPTSWPPSRPKRRGREAIGTPPSRWPNRPSWIVAANAHRTWRAGRSATSRSDAVSSITHASSSRSHSRSASRARCSSGACRRCGALPRQRCSAGTSRRRSTGAKPGSRSASRRANARFSLRSS